MEDLTTSLIVIVFTLLIIVLIFWLTNRNKAQKEQKIKELADGNGWIYEPIRERLAWGYTLKSQSWIFKAVSISSERHEDTGSSNVSSETAWACSAVSPQTALIIRERPASIPTTPALAQLQHWLQNSFDSDYAGLSEVQSLPSSLQQRYLLLADRAGDMDNLFTPALIQQLSNWQGRLPVIKIGREGINIKVEGDRMEKPHEILQIVRLGETLLKTQSF